MDALMLSRLQFAAATFFHFLFVPLTLGLSILVAIMETRFLKTEDPIYRRMADFWGRIFLINFAIGVVTGITLEFQFGTNWSRYSQYVGDIFGSLLAVEATVAFFLESTFIAVWWLGKNRITQKTRTVAIWLVAGASNVSAFWILTANAWMQHPVGYVLRNGRAELSDFLAVITQAFAWVEFSHTLSGAYIVGGMFVAGISAWHLLRKSNVELFKKSFSIGITMAAIFAVVAGLTGHLSGVEVAQKQPAKLAAMESHWETGKGVGMYLLSFPHPEKEKNLVQMFEAPYALSILAHGDPMSKVIGLKDIPKEDRPPVVLTFLSFRVMVGLGTLFILLGVWGWLIRKNPENNPFFLKILPWLIPLPYLAMQFGWIVTEVGRQPWIVYGLMRTKDAVSPIAAHQVGVSLAAFIIVYGLLGLVAFKLIIKYARKGPEPAQN